MSDNTGTLIAKHVRKISHYEGITEGQASVLRNAAQTIDRLADALARAERDLTEQAATIEAIREWWSITLWAQPDWPLLMAIIYPEEGTQ